MGSRGIHGGKRRLLEAGPGEEHLEATQASGQCVDGHWLQSPAPWLAGRAAWAGRASPSHLIKSSGGGNAVKGMG